MHKLNVGDLVRRYQSGESMGSLANSLGVTIKVVRLRLERAGIKIRNSRRAAEIRHSTIRPDETTVIRMYQEGDSELAIARNFGVSRPLIRGILEAHGIPIRNGKQASQIRYSRMSRPDRLRLTQAAHAAVRGVPQSEENLRKSAQGRERMQLTRSEAEIKLAEMLEEKDIPFVPQKAVGRYNVDLALTESAIAVEVFGGNWHAFGSHADRYRRRLDYLLDMGWLPIVVWVNESFPLERGALHYIVAWHDARCYHKPPRCQEHVIRGDGYGGPASKRDANNRPIIPSSIASTDV